MVICSKCGAELETGDKFCTSCGNLIKEGAADTLLKAEDNFKVSLIKGTKEKISNGGGKIKLIVLAVIIISAFVVGGLTMKNHIKASNIKSGIELGNKYINEGKYEEAILAFEKVIKIDSKNVEARVGLAKIYVKTGKRDEAEKLLIEGMYIDPKKVEPYLELANLYISDGNPAQAIEILTDGYKVTNDERIKSMLEDIKSKTVIEDINNTIFLGKSYSLPKEVTVKVDNVPVKYPVKWNATAIDTTKAGTQTFNGTIEGIDKEVKITINVVSITAIDNINTAVKQNDKYSLPSKVIAKMSDSTTQEFGVVWSPANVDTSKPGSYSFQGTVNGYSGKVTLNLNIEKVYTKGEELQVYAALLKDLTWQKKNGIIFSGGKSTIDQHAIRDLDQDGVNEMLIHHGSSMADLTVSVVTYNNGDIKIQHISSSHGGYGGYSKSTKVFFVGGMNQGVSWSAGYKLADGICKRVFTATDNENDVGATEAIYTINGKNVSKAEYDKAFAAFGKIESM